MEFITSKHSKGRNIQHLALERVHCREYLSHIMHAVAVSGAKISILISDSSKAD